MDISEADIVREGMKEIGDDAKRLLIQLPPEMTKEFVGTQRHMFKSMMCIFVLGILTKGESHGYEIIQTLENYDTFGKRISAGTIYPVLHAMEKQGLIKSKWVKRRKIYHVTPKGEKAADAMVEMQKEVIRIKAKFLKVMFNEEVKL